MGTPRFAAEILDELAEFHEIAAVYTRPDAVRGRGKALVPSPVKEVAERRGLPVRTPRTLRDAAVLSELAVFAPDVICVAAYGAILPKEVLDLPPFGCLNVHGSLLPKYRGAAPIQYAVKDGEAVSNDDDNIGLKRCQFGCDLFVPQRVWLQHGNSQFQGFFLYGRKGYLFSAAPLLIRLAIHCSDIEALIVQCLQGRYGKIGCPHKNNT